MLKMIDGDLLELYSLGEIHAIGHCCNCQGEMGSGIALSIKMDFPEAYNSYKDYDRKYGLTLGSVSEWNGIYNLHGQTFYKKSYDTYSSRFVDYEGIYTCLEKMRDSISLQSKPIKTVGFPYKMACDRAGGDWRIIESMIETVFENSELEIVIVKYNKTRNK